VSGSARAEILARIRPAPAPEIPRRYRRAGAPKAVERFCERVAEYRATVHRAAPADLRPTVTAICARRGTRRIVVPPGGPEAIAGLEIIVDDPPLSARALDGLDGVLTGCALAIADTGTIVLDGGERSGRRALTLVPDHHICVVEAVDVVASVPEAIAALDPARPLTFVSGPSATSDIELDRVEGVHGPRVLDVVVVGR
jgi:L-lactate dehydrogenase complex protein LldG